MSLLTSVTQENIRLWAYNAELYFKSNGEEDLLQELEWMPLLLELAADASCPKQKKIETILENIIQKSFLERDSATLATINTFLEEKRHLLTSQWLILTMVNFNYIYGVFQESQRITEAACDKIAKELLQGSQTEINFTKEAPLEDETQVYVTALKQYLYINIYTGEWKTSKYLRWKTFTDASSL